jgi:hypothetical protein
VDTIEQQRARYVALQDYQVIDGQHYHQAEERHKPRRFCPHEHEVFNFIVKEYASELIHAG